MKGLLYANGEQAKVGDLVWVNSQEDLNGIRRFYHPDCVMADMFKVLEVSPESGTVLIRKEGIDSPDSISWFNSERFKKVDSTPSHYEVGDVVKLNDATQLAFGAKYGIVPGEMLRIRKEWNHDYGGKAEWRYHLSHLNEAAVVFVAWSHSTLLLVEKANRHKTGDKAPWMTAQDMEISPVVNTEARMEAHLIEEKKIAACQAAIDRDERLRRELDRPCKPKYQRAYMTADLGGNPWSRR